MLPQSQKHIKYSVYRYLAPTKNNEVSWNVPQQYEHWVCIIYPAS